MMDRLHHQLLYASCKIIAALHDINARLKHLEIKINDESLLAPRPSDAVWESLHISAVQLDLLKDPDESEDWPNRARRDS